MEINFSLIRVDNLRMRMAGLLVGLAILFFSCERKIDLPAPVESQQAIQQMINQGELLNSFSKSDEGYVLSFENEILRVPLKEITRIESNPSKWKTTITFNDQKQLEIPSKGGSLEFIIEDVKLNPSGYNPLAAMVEVNLPTFGRVKVTVHGKESTAADITHLLKDQTPRQSIPIFGLYPDYDNDVELAFTDKEGNVRGTVKMNIKTGKLPDDFPKRLLVKSEPQKMEPGINLINYLGESAIDVSVPYMVDCYGDVRWVLFLKSSPDLGNMATDIGLHRTKKGTFLAGDVNQPRIVEIDMFGNLLKQWDLKTLGYTFHHDIFEMENGNLLMTLSKTSARRNNGQPRINDIVVEFDPLNNSIVKEWDLVNIVDSARILPPDDETPVQFNQNPTNWAHNNSITKMGENILGTMRYQGIFSFTPEGKLRWLISPHKYWAEKFKPYLLTPVDESGTEITDPDVIQGNASTPGFDWSWGPHSAVVLSNDHILVFDNGYNRNWIPNWATSNTNYSRVVEYKVDVSQHTVQQVWSYGKERGTDCFSPAMSSVQYLSQTKNILFSPGMNIMLTHGLGGRVVEVNPVTKEVVFELELSASSAMAFQRAIRMPLYPDNF